MPKQARFGQVSFHPSSFSVDRKTRKRTLSDLDLAISFENPHQIESCLEIWKSGNPQKSQWPNEPKSMLVFCGLKNTRTATFWPGVANLNFEPKRESHREVKKTWDLTFEKCPKVENTWFCLPKRTTPGPSTRINQAFWGPILGLTSLLWANSRPNQPSWGQFWA